MEKLLVTVLGNRDSGKSKTWHTLFGKTVKTGNHERHLYFNEHEYVNVFLINGSPEERETDVEELLPENKPSIVLCSTQYKESVKNTFNYFINNEYFIFAHWLNPGYSDLETPYFDNLGLLNWLLSQQSLVGIRSGKLRPNPRVEEIKEFIYSWAKARNLVLSSKSK